MGQNDVWKRGIYSLEQSLKNLDMSIALLKIARDFFNGANIVGEFDLEEIEQDLERLYRRLKLICRSYEKVVKPSRVNDEKLGSLHRGGVCEN